MIRTLKGHNDIVWDLSLLNDGRYLVSCGTDGNIKTWFWRDAVCTGKYF